MKKTVILIAGTSLILLLFTVSGTPDRESAPPLSVENMKLMNEISGLEDKISALEYKIDKLESKLDKLDDNIYRTRQEIIDKVEDVESAIKSLR